MQRTHYIKLVYTLALLYPAYWLVLFIALKFSPNTYGWLQGADIIGGNGGPTSLLIVQGQFRLSVSLFLSFAGLMILSLLILYRKHFPGEAPAIAATMFGALIWSLSTYHHFYWIIKVNFFLP